MAFGFGEPLEQMVDLNFQSGPDARVDSRVHLYSAALHLRFGVPVRSVLIIRLDPVRSEPHRTASNCSSLYNRSVVTFV